MLHTKKEFAAICKLNKSTWTGYLRTYIVRGKLIETKEGLIDDSIQENKYFMAKCIERNKDAIDYVEEKFSYPDKILLLKRQLEYSREDMTQLLTRSLAIGLSLTEINTKINKSIESISKELIQINKRINSTIEELNNL